MYKKMDTKVIEVIEKEALVCLNIAARDLGILKQIKDACDNVEDADCALCCFRSNMIDTFWSEYRKISSNDIELKFTSAIIYTVKEIARDYEIDVSSRIARATNNALEAHTIIDSTAKKQVK